MGKKLSRSKRKELREQGVFEAPSASVLSAKREMRRAEASSTSARTVIAKTDGAASAHTDDEETAPAPAEKAPAKPDRTVLVLVALTALAAVIFWLTQRSPNAKETKIEASPGAAPLSSAKR
ncbi:Hypothetical protein A7982_07834 [Minicystis rosea]|nr:Hypothetical protein A7982_07834 [Minicystis rosea]